MTVETKHDDRQSMPTGIRARGAPRGTMGRGGAFGAARGMRGGGARGGVPAARGMGRGGIGMKRKTPDSFQGMQVKKLAGGDAWGDSWSTQPIVQQPLGSSDAQWYQDSWS